jgi:cobalt-zinc-cadmium efflux system membrane fusion protein
LFASEERAGARPPIRVTLAAAMVGVAAALALAGCSRQARPPGTGAAASDSSTTDADFVLRDDARGVSTAVVQSESLADHLEIAGRIQADPTRLVRVYPPVSGRLVAVQVRPSDRVAQGQVLAILASSDVAAARAAYRQARADAQVKRQGLDRAQLLYDHHVIALRDYQQAQADAAMTAATLESATERLVLLDVDTASTSDQLTIVAPRAGVVIDVGAAPGEYAKSLDNANPLCTIADLSTVWAVGDVYEKDVASITIGDWADLTANAYPDGHWHGRVSAVSSVVDTTTRTLKVRVILANPGLRLKPDMFGTIRVVRGTRHAVMVPQSAIVREGAAAYVFVQTVRGHFARRAVTLGSEADRDRVEVSAGLVAGDVVVVQGAELLRVAASSS